MCMYVCMYVCVEYIVLIFVDIYVSRKHAKFDFVRLADRAVVVPFYLYRELRTADDAD